MNKIKILFVCEGNLCRSPLAHAILNRLVLENALEQNVSIDSSGFVPELEGKDYHPFIQKICEREGIALIGKSRITKLIDLEENDLIFAMDNEIYKKLIDLSASKEQNSKIQLFGSILSTENAQEIPDPIGKDFAAFELLYENLNNHCSALIEALLAEINY
ncbi:MAG: hypothetical protein M9962_00515 [Oligoflexia bacterium]|nr:hypothetical protein [Oligoflexia bacterium]